MPAHEALNPDQLQLFMSPGEIMDRASTSADIHAGETMGDMWRRKEAASREPKVMDQGFVRHSTGVYDSVKEEGVTSHVQVYPWSGRTPGHFGMGEGHHRVAAAAAVGRDRAAEGKPPGKEQHIPVVYGHMSMQERRKLYPQSKREGWV